jgi:type I restriction enzyme S subunit
MKVKLSDVCEVYSGYSLKSFNDDEEGLPVVKIGNIHTDGTLNLDECQYTTDNVNEKYYSNEGDIYIALSGATTGKIGIMHSDDKYIINQRVGIVRKKNGNIPQDYIKYFLLRQSDRILQEAAGCAQPNISPKQIAEYLIPNISENEMMNISFTLDKVKGVIDSRKQELEQLDLLIKARFVELFEKKEYPVEKLSNVCLKITDGTHKTPNYLDDGVTFISAKNIVNGELDFTDIKHISEEEYQEIQKRCQTEMFDILLSKSGSLGSPVIVKTTEKLGLFESLAVIKYDRDKLLPEFLCEQLKSDRIQRQFTIGTKGVAIKHLHLGVIGDTDIIVPPIEVQQQFADFVAQVDKSKLKGEIVSKYRKYGRANC